MRIAPTLIVVLCLTWQSLLSVPPARAQTEIHSPKTDHTPAPTKVLTAFGPVTGTVEHAIYAYRGIPYASPPVGDLRWKPPIDPQPWAAPRACTQFTPAAPQTLGGFGGHTGATSEDCLYLNVWTPTLKPDAKLPVMVWIHGGGFVQGTAGAAHYDGVQLARREVVVVSLNYRLGLLGFLAHPALSAESPDHVSGNYGLLDQIHALKWVQNNIARFGGDPRNVTIFGQSAGGVSVAALLSSPLTEGLFHRAIIQSGSFPPRLRKLRESSGLLASAESTGQSVARQLGVADGPDAAQALRAKSVADILRVQKPMGLIPGTTSLENLCIDGRVLTETPGAALAAGRVRRVPVMLGSTADEGTIFLMRARTMNLAAYRALMQTIMGPQTEAAMKLYPAKDDPSVRRALTEILGDLFIASARRAARDLSARDLPVYLYHFTHQPPYARALGLGAFHGAEIPYVFGNLPDFRGFTKDDAALAEWTQDYWVNFARTGDPNPPAAGGAPTTLPAWPRYRTERDEHFILDVKPAVGKNLRQEQCDILDARLRGE